MKENINTLFISLLWAIAPSLVILLSFMVYTRFAGRLLDIPSAPLWAAVIRTAEYRVQPPSPRSTSSKCSAAP
jgi:hypothetical protein